MMEGAAAAVVVRAGQIRVLIVDDHVAMRETLRRLLEHADGIDVVAEAADGAEAIRAARDHMPDVVLLDIAMPRMDGLVALSRILAAAPRTRVVVITMFDRDEAAFRALREGASAFILKNAPPEDVVRAVRLVHQGDRILAPELTGRLIDRWVAPSAEGLLHTLPERERETVALIARGLSNAEIAAHMFVTETTVRTYVSRILSKSGARDRAQLVVMAYEQGIVDAAGM